MRAALLLCVLLAVPGLALATGDTTPAVVTGTLAGVTAETPSVPEKLFATAAAFHGTLGEQKIQVSLRQKQDMREGLEGEYFLFGRSQKILLAGEFERDGTVFLEESEDGHSVSGQWDGRLDGAIFSGTWSSFDGTVSKPFALKIIPAKARLPLQRMTGPALLDDIAQN